DYRQLIDWTGRAILANKCGHIPKDQPPVLEWLQVDPMHWLYMTQHFESKLKGLVGTAWRPVRHWAIGERPILLLVNDCLAHIFFTPTQNHASCTRLEEPHGGWFINLGFEWIPSVES
ncbi:MAG: hypothetical protein KZQ88_14180, partial [Candidatus Thiodiazotropha sp. (ex Dulcina madagascariensis)]|nr:hypothetical protein [Candidatus Thiodiazotropha sp. (ex Dulcina madagascariensis)]